MTQLRLITLILDTNVFVAAYWAKSSASARLFKACINGKVQAQYTKEIKDEVMHILRLVNVSESFINEVESFWARSAKINAGRADNVHIDDPDDRKFLEASVGGETDFLATNDEHLLRVGYIGRTEILTPGSLVKLLEI